MKFKYKTYAEVIAAKKRWHKHFAWWPLWENGTIFWLEFVERRLERVWSSPFCYQEDYEYKGCRLTKEDLYQLHGNGD